MASHAARVPSSGVTASIPFQHGNLASILLCILYYFDEFRLPEGLPAGVVDMDRSANSRNIIRNLDSFTQTEIVDHYSNIADARIALQKGKIYGFFYIPEGLSADAQSQRQPKVSFYTNYSYLIAGSLLFRDMKMMEN